MDVVTVSFLIAAGVGAVAAGAHMMGYVPPRYKRMLRDVQGEFASKVGGEVERALQRVAAQQEAKYAEGAEAAVKSADMSMVRAVGVDRAQVREMNAMMVEGMLGPVLSAVEMWNPAWADKLREMDPQLLMRMIESPFFQTHIRPRIEPLLKQFMSQGHVSTEGTTWGT